MNMSDIFSHMTTYLRRHHTMRLPWFGGIRGVGSVECGVRSAECGVRSAECGVRSAECGVRSAECGVRSAECGVRSEENEKKTLLPLKKAYVSSQNVGTFIHFYILSKVISHFNRPISIY